VKITAIARGEAGRERLPIKIFEKFKKIPVVSDEESVF
jgi:hypothetical protein